MFSVCRKMALECFYIPELCFCHWTGVHEWLSLLALKVFQGLFLLGENVVWRRTRSGGWRKDMGNTGERLRKVRGEKKHVREEEYGR